ncbi:MFS-type transporter dbaD [Exophiala dermatitidis]
MSSSTILDDDVEKETQAQRPHQPERLGLTRTRSSLDEALDAAANIDEDEDESGPPVNNTATSPADHAPPPNGGFHAWLQVAGSFFLFFNCWGTVNAFGVFQTYYETNPYWHESPSNISWIGSIQAFLLLLIGVITGPAYDAGYFRALVTTGAILIPLGFMMTSLAKEYWQTMLAQALCIGIGNGCLFIPSVAILPQYFSTKKALANGIAAAGSSVGGVIYPIVFRQVEQQLGFGWATRIIGFISLATVWFSVLVMKPRVMPKHKRHLTDLAAFKELPYTLFCIAMFFGFIGFYGPIYYIQTYAIQEHITTEHLAFYLLPILNAASVPGRIIPNFIADRTGPLNALIPCALMTAVLAFVWIAVKNLGGTIVFALLYGMFSGGFVSMPPVAIVSLTKDMHKLGTRMGQCFFISAFGLLVGTPVSGAILNNSGKWIGVQLFSAITICITGCLFVWARIDAVGYSVRKRA